MAGGSQPRSRMFHVDGKPMKTWNVFVGCSFSCSYCNARQLATTRLKNLPRYRDGFTPHMVESELERHFSPGDFVFIGYMGDISFAGLDLINYLLDELHSQPEVNFLFCTKNPIRYLTWPPPFPDNLYFGATIESTEDYGFSKAPPPGQRYSAMLHLEHPRKLISIEPICDFNLVRLLKWVYDIRPEIVEIGADNYHNDLPEPPWEKVEKLIKGLEGFCPNVIQKKGLERLKRL